MKKVLPLAIFVVIVPIFLCSFWNIFPIKYKGIIVEYSERYDLPPELVSSLINAESGFQSDAVSGAGAVGLMQVLPSTASEIARKCGAKDFDLLNPKTNIEFGCCYLRYLLDFYDGDVVYALCSYNAGLNNVKYWDFDGDIEKIPIEQTKNYVKKIIKNLTIYKQFYYKI